MPDANIIKVPLVSVALSEDDTDSNYTRIRYYVGDIMVMDMSVEEAVVPLRTPDGFFPEMTLTQLFVTPHQHLALLGEFLAVSKSIDPNNVPFPPDRWAELIQQTESLLSPPPPPPPPTLGDVPVTE